MMVTRNPGIIWILSSSTLLVAACASGGSSDPDGGAAAGVVAPSELKVVELAGGAHPTWKDNSDDEAGLVLERALGEEAFASHKMLDFNTTDYHDGPLAIGTRYRYRLAAMAKGPSKVLSSYSNEVSFMLRGGGSQPDGAAGASDAAHAGTDAGHGGATADAAQGPAMDAAVRPPDSAANHDAGHDSSPDAGAEAGHGGGHM